LISSTKHGNLTCEAILSQGRFRGGRITSASSALNHKKEGKLKLISRSEEDSQADSQLENSYHCSCLSFNGGRHDNRVLWEARSHTNIFACPQRGATKQNIEPRTS
jgi:hypothetical protein